MNNIKFHNSPFEQAVRDNLGVPSRELTKEDLYMITGIHIHQGKVHHNFLEQDKDSLLVIELNLQENHPGWQQDMLFFKHISFLNISIPTEDILFLANFIKLKELVIDNSSNRNWSFLFNLVELKYLTVFDSQFSDLQPLEALAFNQRQFFENRKLTLAKAVSMFYQGLSDLRLINCGITDLAPLIHSNWLTDLDLSSNKIVDWSVLTKLRSLSHLSLRKNMIDDINPIHELAEVRYLNFRYNNIEDLSPLEDYINHNLTFFYIGYNRIKNVEPVKKFKLRGYDTFDPQHGSDDEPKRR